MQEGLQGVISPALRRRGMRNAALLGALAFGTIGAVLGGSLGAGAIALEVWATNLRRTHHEPDLPPELARQRREAARQELRRQGRAGRQGWRQRRR